ncbi:MAG TPA: caspase family protein [Xanthobacteraceae bacterium]|jgi:peptidoglycan hydrolase-like protein with peptidoglycan-binding domain|nr:caspase family protein [Xanthobacteraceae bacterium]
MNKIVLCAIALGLGLSAAIVAPQAAWAEKRVALVVGNSAYQHAPAIANPVRDAKAVAEKLEKSGFDVVTAQYDLDIVSFKRAVRKFEDVAASADIAVVYYAGHALQIEGANYLVPVDAAWTDDRDAEDEAVTLERLVESVDGAKRLRIVILDACRDKPFAFGAKHERNEALVGGKSGLGAAEPTAIDTLIAYAAKAGSVEVEGTGDHTPFTIALIDNMFVPGLDIRLAFGRVRDQVLKSTANKQEPFVYGSLGATNMSLVALSQNTEVGGEENDYHLVERIGSARAWQVFIAQHPTGSFAEMARQQIAKLTMSDAVTEPQAQAAAQAVSPAPEAAKPAETEKGAALAKEQVAVLDKTAATPAAPASPTPDTSRDLIRKAQQELARVGCYAGGIDGAFGPGTAGALVDYENARGGKGAGDVKVTDDLVAELTKQSSRVCPLTCGAGKVAQGDQCVAVQKPPTAPKKEEAQAAPAPRPAVIKQQAASGGGGGAGRVSMGVGF